MDGCRWGFVRGGRYGICLFVGMNAVPFLRRRIALYRHDPKQSNRRVPMTAAMMITIVLFWC